MDIGKRLRKAQELLDRQEVSHLLALELPEAIEQLPYLSGRVQAHYLRLLSKEKLCELAHRIFTEDAARDLGISPEELTSEQFQVWCKDKGYGGEKKEARAMGPSFETD